MNKFTNLQDAYRYLNGENVRIKQIMLRLSTEVQVTYHNLARGFTWMRVLKRESGKLLRMKFLNEDGRTNYSLNIPFSQVRSVQIDESSKQIFIHLRNAEIIEITIA